MQRDERGEVGDWAEGVSGARPRPLVQSPLLDSLGTRCLVTTIRRDGRAAVNALDNAASKCFVKTS